MLAYPASSKPIDYGESVLSALGLYPETIEDNVAAKLIAKLFFVSARAKNTAAVKALLFSPNHHLALKFVSALFVSPPRHVALAIS